MSAARRSFSPVSSVSRAWILASVSLTWLCRSLIWRESSARSRSSREISPSSDRSSKRRAWVAASSCASSRLRLWMRCCCTFCSRSASRNCCCNWLRFWEKTGSEQRSNKPSAQRSTPSAERGPMALGREVGAFLPGATRHEPLAFQRWVSRVLRLITRSPADGCGWLRRPHLRPAPRPAGPARHRLSVGLVCSTPVGRAEAFAGRRR